MRKFTLILSLLVATIASAFAQTEYTLDMANGEVTNMDYSRGRGYALKAVGNSDLEFNFSMQDYLISKVNDCIKIVTDGDNVYKDITIAAPEGYEITACSFSFVSTRGGATATVNFGNDIVENSKTGTQATLSGDFSASPANSITFSLVSTQSYQGIIIKEIKVTVKSNQTEGGEGGDNGDGNEGEGGDNGDGNEGEGGDNGDGNEGEGGDNGDGNEGEGEGGEVEGGDNNEEGEDTSINDVEVETSQVIYDLTGRRVNEITKAGIYIINGKKVVVNC